MKRVEASHRSRLLWTLGMVLALLALVGCDQKNESAAGESAAGAACAGDGASGCLTRGLDLVEGNGGTKDPVAGAALYMQVCDAGDARGCTMTAHLYADGAQGDSPQQSIAQDNVKALELYERACAANDAFGCFHAGNAYGIGELDTKTDPKKSYEYLKRSCDNGGPPEACKWAEMVKKTAEMPSPEAREKSCRDGDNKACQDLGMDLRKGSHGLEVDVAKALEIFQVACDAGDGLSCTGAALIHEKGELGGEPDLVQFEAMLTKACDADESLACKTLGRHYFTGKKLGKDTRRAAPLLDKACHAAVADFEACTWLAIAYREGDGVKADAQKSTTLLTRACEEGKDELACEAIGR